MKATSLAPSHNAAAPSASEDFAFQAEMLQGVSRTFALTIPQLPEGLRHVVGNAYLLCRIADTIEDADTLTIEQKKYFGDAFVAVVAGQASARDFGAALSPLLTGRTLDTERELVAQADRVLRVTHGFSREEQAALLRCVQIMTEGMEAFEESQFSEGVRNMAQMDAYCYHVAGVVGEMLTTLFCLHSPVAARRRRALEALAVSFGQGLQMTNILKDVWDDKQRGVCWLPIDVFARHGYDIRALAPDHLGPAYAAGMLDLVAAAHGHLKNALAYTLLLPRREIGVRKFCLWALGMAVLTLQNIRRNPAFTSGHQVKISRRSVKAVVVVTHLIGWSNLLLRGTFFLATRGLPNRSTT